MCGSRLAPLVVQLACQWCCLRQPAGRARCGGTLRDAASAQWLLGNALGPAAGCSRLQEGRASAIGCCEDGVVLTVIEGRDPAAASSASKGKNRRAASTVLPARQAHTRLAGAAVRQQCGLCGEKLPRESCGSCTQLGLVGLLNPLFGLVRRALQFRAELPAAGPSAVRGSSHCGPAAEWEGA